MKTSVIDPSDPEWDDALQQAQHDSYHLSEYVRIEAARLDAIPQAIVVREQSRLFFLPYLVRRCDEIGTSATDILSPYGYPGYVFSDDARNDDDFRTAAIHATAACWKRHGACCAFLRLHPLLNPTTPELDGIECHRRTTPTVIVDLTPDPDAIWNNTNRKRRTSIRKCQRLGMTARETDYWETLPIFQDIYRETMQRASASDTYFFDDDYFDAIGRLGEHAAMMVIEYQGEVIAATIMLVTGGIVQAHLGGSRTEFLPFSPFGMLLYEAALWSKERGHQRLHLGGGLGGKEDRLFAFKAGFSPDRGACTTVRMVIDSQAYQRLVEQRAAAASVTPEALLATEFFPAYRAELTR